MTYDIFNIVRKEIYRGMLFDLEMVVYTEDDFMSIKLDVEGELDFHSYSLDDIIKHLKTKFDYLLSIDENYANHIRKFTNNFYAFYTYKHKITKVMEECWRPLLSFVHLYVHKGTLNPQSFKIGELDLVLNNYKKKYFVLEPNEITEIKRSAYYYRGKVQSYSIPEDVYCYLETKLQKLFIFLEQYNITTITYKTLQISKNYDKV